MSPTGPYLPASAIGVAGANTAWTNITNITASDGAYASATLAAGAKTNLLKAVTFGFAIPSTGIIDGILVEVQELAPSGHTNTASAQMVKAGVSTGTAKSDAAGVATWPTSLGWIGYGSATDLWGTTWTPSDINNGNFGFQIQAQNTASGGVVDIDAIRITIYWHTTPIKIPQGKYYLYKVYDSLSGAYLGNLPNVISDFAFSQDINTAGAQITVQCGISADTSNQAVRVLTDEAGNTLTDEANNVLTDEGVAPQTGVGTGTALIRDGNRVKVWEFSYYYPNGVCLFSGEIERHEDSFGGDTGDNHVNILLYSDGSDMDNRLIRGNPYVYTLDQSQTSNNFAGNVNQDGSGNYTYYGQTFTSGAGVTNIGAISLLLNGSATVTISVYTSSNVGAGATLLGSTSQAVSVGTPTVVQFNFPLHIAIKASTQYFFTVTVPSGQSITPYIQSISAVYTGGLLYQAVYSGGSGGSYVAAPGADLYFNTYSSTGSTTATFTAVDPTSGMLSTIMSDYASEGGLVGVGNIQFSGLSLNYGFNTQTVYQGLQGTLTVSPSGYYYYVDLGLNLLYFQQANTVADFVLTKGVHISKLKIVSTIEYVINTAYVVGADVAGSNVYTLDTDAASIALYGQRLQVHNDNNIPNTTTAHIVGQNIVKQNKNEQYQTTVFVPDGTMDTTKLVPGKIIGFNGFGTYVDFLLAQIVHRDYSSQGVMLTLGILPKREAVAVDQVVRGLAALNTVTNPTSPS